jgi:small subunit ribosomal protein S1
MGVLQVMDMDREKEDKQQANDNGAAEEEPDFLQMLEASFDYSPLERGDIRQALILQVRPNEILVDLGAKRDGLVTIQDLDRLDDEMRKALHEGQEVPVYVLNPRDQDDNLVVSINLGLQQYDWERARALLESQDVTEVTVTGYNKGGMLVEWGRLEGFIPYSHLMTMSAEMAGRDRRDAFDSLQGRTLGVKVIEVDQKRRRLIFSEREAQREWRAQQKARLMTELMEGDVVRGKVTGIRDFGVFVDLGGADGLIHVSELAWHRVEHPNDVLDIGDEIDVYVLDLDHDRNRIALSRKRLLSDPWDDALERYHEGQLVYGTVTNVVDFGAFIVLDDGLEGLLHLSEMGDGSLQEPFSYMRKGDRLLLRISRLEPHRRRVGFTQRDIPDEASENLDDEGEPPAGVPFEPDEAPDVEASADVEAQDEAPDVTAASVEDVEAETNAEVEVQDEAPDVAVASAEDVEAETDVEVEAQDEAPDVAVASAEDVEAETDTEDVAVEPEAPEAAVEADAEAASVADTDVLAESDSGEDDSADTENAV